MNITPQDKSLTSDSGYTFIKRYTNGDGQCFYHAIANVLARCSIGKIHDDGDTTRVLQNREYFSKNSYDNTKYDASVSTINNLRGYISNHLRKFIIDRPDAIEHLIQNNRTGTDLAGIDQHNLFNRQEIRNATIGKDLTDYSNVTIIANIAANAIQIDYQCWGGDFELNVLNMALATYGIFIQLVRTGGENMLIDSLSIVQNFTIPALLNVTIATPPSLSFIFGGTGHWSWVDVFHDGIYSAQLFPQPALLNLQRGGAGNDYLCDPSSTASNYQLKMGSSNRNANDVMEAVVSSICHNKKALASKRMQGKCSLSIRGNVIEYNGEDGVVHALYTSAQVEAFINLPRLNATAPHIIVQYLVTVIAMACIAEDIKAPGKGNCANLHTYLDDSKLSTTLTTAIAFPSCLTVTPTDERLIIELNNQPAAPLRIEVKFSEHRIPPFVLSMVLLNFMGGAAIERITNTGPPFTKTPETWSKLINNGGLPGTGPAAGTVAGTVPGTVPGPAAGTGTAARTGPAGTRPATEQTQQGQSKTILEQIIDELTPPRR